MTAVCHESFENKEIAVIAANIPGTKMQISIQSEQQ